MAFSGMQNTTKKIFLGAGKNTFLGAGSAPIANFLN